MKIKYNDIEKFILLIKLVLPKGHFKATMYLLYIGGALLANNLFGNILQALIAEWFNINIPNIHPLYGVVIIIVSLIYSYSMFKLNFQESKASKEDEQKTIESDKLIFKKMDDIFNEAQLMAFLNHVGSTHQYMWSDTNKFIEYTFEIDLIENEFHNYEIKEGSQSLKKAISSLLNFMNSHFDASRNSNSGNLYRKGNIDLSNFVSPGDNKRYDKLVNELFPLIKETENGYKKYRKLIKENLKV